MLDGFVYKMRGIHGTRWVASMRNILAKVYKMLHIILLDLDMRAKEKFGCASHTMHTADEMFMGVQFKPDGETRKYRVSGTVPTNDASSMTLFQATTLRGEQTIEIAKAALLDVLGKCVEVHEVCTKCAAVTYSSRCDKCKGKSLCPGPEAQVAESTIRLVPCVPHRHACLTGARELDLSAR